MKSEFQSAEHEVDNIELAKRATSHLSKRYDEVQRGMTEFGALEYQPFFDLLADDFVFKVSCPEDTPIWGGEVHGKEAFIRLATVDDRDHIDYLTVDQPLEFFGSGDRVVVLTAYSYKLGAGVMVHSEIALILDFRDGLIARALEIQDMSEWVYLCRTGS